MSNVNIAESDMRTYTVKEIQAILKVSLPTAYRIAESGKFSCVRVGGRIRISKRSFDEWLDRQYDGWDRNVDEQENNASPSVVEKLDSKKDEPVMNIQKAENSSLKADDNVHRSDSRLAEDMAMLCRMMENPETASMIKAFVSAKKAM